MQFVTFCMTQKTFLEHLRFSLNKVGLHDYRAVPILNLWHRWVIFTKSGVMPLEATATLYRSTPWYNCVMFLKKVAVSLMVISWGTVFRRLMYYEWGYVPEQIETWYKISLLHDDMLFNPINLSIIRSNKWYILILQISLYPTNHC
jgi:hypothetical protein